VLREGPRPAILWDRADLILALESDFLGTEGWSIEQVRQFASRRDVVTGAAFNRVYCVEGGVSLTGSNADYRLRLRPDAQLEFVLSLIHELSIGRGTVEPDAALATALRGRSLKDFAATHGLDSRVLAISSTIWSHPAGGPSSMPDRRCRKTSTSQ